MVDHVLVAATETLDSAAAKTKIPCGAEMITERDHRAVLLSELGADAKIIADALAARPDLTLAQVRASWSHFEPRIRAGRCTAGAFFAAIRRGQLHAPPPEDRLYGAADVDQLNAKYGDLFRLGSDMTGLAPPACAPPLAPDDADETPSQAARRLLPHGAPTDDLTFVMCRLACGDDESTALAELAAHRRRR